MTQSVKRKIFYSIPVLVSVLAFSCAEDDQIVNAFKQALSVEIVAGPEAGGTVLNNAPFTFEWRGIGGGSAIRYEVQLSNVDAQAISTTETAKSYPGQPEGSYTFTVTARAGNETATASRAFNVGPNLGPPQVVISGPRGAASSGGSGETPAYAPGRPAFFRWTGEDVDRFGEVTGYRWRISDSAPFTEFTLATVAGFNVPAAPGTYTFTIEAKDNNDAVSTTTLDYVVKNPTILIVDDKPQGSQVDEVDEDGFYADLFEGFAFATWDVATDGEPTADDLAPFRIVVLYSGGGSAIWRAIGENYPEAAVPLSQFIDGGGRLWAMGQGIMEDIAAQHENPPDPAEFEAVYLHLAAATGDSATDAGLQWSRAGAFSGDGKFSFADDVLGDALNFPRITMNVQSGDVDEIVPAADAEIIYGGKDGLGNPVGDVALRFPAGGTNTRIVFQTFPLYESAAVKASLLNSRALAQEIMREMGE